LILKRITDIFILFEVQQSKRGFYKMIRRQFLSLLLLLTILTFHCTHLKNAHQAYEENNYRQVITLCRQAIASDSTDTEAYLLLTKSYHALDSLELALKVIQKTRQLASESPEILSEIVQIHIDLGDRALSQENSRKALSHYDAAESLCPNDTTVLQRMADLHYKEGRLDRAIRKYEELMKVKADSTTASKSISQIKERTEKAESLHLRGMTALKRNKLRTAKSLFSKALKEKPDFTDVRYQLYMTEGHLLFNEGSKNALWDAIAAFGMAGNLHSEAAEPHFRMAQAYEKKNPEEFVNAIDEYETALQLEPEGPHANACKKKIKELKTRKEKLDKFWGRKK